MQQKIENLVFEGGGTKGSAYAGCAQVLEERELLAGVRRISGTSAGAITATILSLGGGSSGLTNSVEHTNFAQFLEDPWGILGEVQRTITHYGMHTGHEFVEILKSIIGQFTGNPELTFSQLDKLVAKSPSQYKQLTIIASNLTTQRSEIFNSGMHGDLEIWKAVRASMSSTMIFQPMVINGDYFVDGGLSWNYPIDIYDKKVKTETHLETIVEVNPATLGFFLEPQELVDQGGRFKTNDYKINSIRSFASGLASYLYETANSKHMHPSDRERTVFIDDLGVSGTNFSITKEQIEALIQSGRDATHEYFDRLSDVSNLSAVDAG